MSAARRRHHRLRRRVDPRAGGTDGLVELLDAALTAVESRRDQVRAPPPAQVLGLDGDAGSNQARVAYRRLARLVHPDLGGTAGLFRAVASALDAIEAPPRVAGGSPKAPPRPPPPPFVAPPPDQRPPRNRRAAALELALAAGAVASAVLVIAGLLSLLGSAGRVFLGIPLIFAGYLSTRGWLNRGARAAVVLVGTFARVDPDISPVAFLEETCFDIPVARERHVTLWEAYAEWCYDRTRSPVSQWVFVEQLRSVGLLYIQPAPAQPGIWVGVQLREPVRRRSPWWAPRIP